MTKMLFITLHF